MVIEKIPIGYWANKERVVKQIWSLSRKIKAIKNHLKFSPKVVKPVEAGKRIGNLLPNKYSLGNIWAKYQNPSG
jgi:hypothetical protein